MINSPIYLAKKRQRWFNIKKTNKYQFFQADGPGDGLLWFQNSASRLERT